MLLFYFINLFYFISRTDMYSILAAIIVIFDAVLSLQTRNSYEVNKYEIREKRQYSPVIPNEVKGLVNISDK